MGKRKSDVRVEVSSSKPVRVVDSDASCEKIAKAMESRGLYVERHRGEKITVYGPNGKATIRKGTPWRTVWAALKMIGVLTGLFLLAAQLLG